MEDGVLSIEEFTALEARARAGDEEAKNRLYRDYGRTTEPGLRSRKMEIILNGRPPRS